MQLAKLVLVTLAVTAWSSAQEQVARLTRDEAVKDARVFLQLLESSHPDPYTNLGGKVAFKRQAQALLKAIPNSGLTVPQFADRLSLFIAPLKDGHTKIRGAQERWRDQAPRLSVRMQIASDGLVMTGSDIPALKGSRGYKLAAINGVPVDELLKRMETLVATENRYGTYLWLTEILGSAKMLKNILPNLDSSLPVAFTLESPKGKSEIREVPWATQAPKGDGQWIEPPVRWPAFDRSDRPFCYRFLADGNTAYFRVANMMPREGYEIARGYKVGDFKELVQQYYAARQLTMPEDLEAALKGIPSVFEPGTELLEQMKHRGTSNLIVDFRGNTGGSTPTIMPFLYQVYGDRLFGHSSQAEFVQVHSQLYLQKYNSTVEKEKLKDPNFELGEYVFDGPEQGDAQEKRKAKLTEWKDRGLPFVSQLEPLDGKPLYSPKRVVVLCDPLTFSAAFQATFMLHELGAKIVGVPPAQSPNAFMEGTPFQLPTSGIKGIISNGMQLYLPRTPEVNVLHLDFAVTTDTVRR